MSLQFSFLIVHAVKYLQRLIYPSEGKQINKNGYLMTTLTLLSCKNKETPAEVVLSSLHNTVVFTGIVL